MIEFMAESAGNVLGLRATGKLSRADYLDVLMPHTQTLLDRFSRLRVLFLMDETFQGWSLGAAWTNTTFDVRHRRDFEKVAMVGAPKWEECCLRTGARLLMNGELRTFRHSQLTQAWQWLRT